MDVTQNFSFIGMIRQASVPVQGVMLLLLLASILSWFYIFRKYLLIRHVRNQSRQFEQEFWSGMELSALYQRIAGRTDLAGMGKIFEAGFKEFSKLKKQNVADPTALLDGTRRAMRIAYQKEMDWLENNLAFLATVGSVSPYVGLFGTVWGIMTAFRGLANMVQATLAHVAPGIAEALVATAMGLFAAIPAVVAYNRFSHDIERLDTQFDNFMEEFSNIVHRQSLRG